MLDVSIRVGLLNVMASLRDDQGVSLLYITHDIASARYVSDRVLVMYAGHLVEAGPIEEVLQHPVHPYTRLLLSAVPDPRAELARHLERRGRTAPGGQPGRGVPVPPALPIGGGGVLDRDAPACGRGARARGRLPCECPRPATSRGGSRQLTESAGKIRATAPRCSAGLDVPRPRGST